MLRKRGKNMEDHRENPGHMPTPMSYGKRLWYLWGPLIIKWLISMVTSSAVMVAYITSYASAHQEEFVKIYGSQEEMMQFTMEVTEKLMPFLTYIEGAAALVTIPVMLIMFFQDRKKEKLYGVLQPVKAPLWKYTGIFAIATTLCVGINNLINIGNLSKMSEAYQETSKSFYSVGFDVQIICLGFLIPIAEELVFRGLIFKRMRTLGGFMQAAVFSSLVFGVFHGNMVQMLYGVFMGMLFAYVYEKYGSVKAPILAHITVNVISVVATHFKFFEWLLKDPLRTGLLTVLCGTVSAAIFVWMQKIGSKTE